MMTSRRCTRSSAGLVSAVGTVATETFTVANTGGTAVTLTKSKPPDGGAFTALTSLAEGTTIQPGASVTETVSFAPTQTGQASGVWLINGNDAHPRVHEVQFTGVGVVPAVPSEVTSVTPPSTPPSLLAPVGAVSPVKVSGTALRLAALRGKVGVATSCGIYTVRPEVCRTCMPGDPECEMARKKHGLPALV